MMNGAGTSVALCTYNGARFLPEQLESIAAQVRRPDELVVCDDGSSDRTVEIVSSFATHAPFEVRFEINARNVGATKNFEKAIGLCRGEIIALADQDDIWKPQKLAVLEATLKEHPEAGYAFSDAELIGEAGERLRGSLWKSVRFEGSVLRNFFGSGQVAALLHRSAVTGATMAFRSSLRRVLLPVASYFAHDYWISLLASSTGSYGIPISERLIQYRQHDGQLIGARRRSILEKVKRARRMQPGEYAEMTAWHLTLRDRLLAAAATGQDVPVHHMRWLDEKIQHCSCREQVHTTRGSAKIGRVVSEVIKGRYARYSNSWASVVEDLCF